MQVQLTDKMGSDLTVVNAARVSYAKNKEQFEDKDEKLIAFLAKHNHWSPFAHASLQFRIKAPVFVARQLVKHQIGLTWNEVSRRYVDYPPELHTPKEWRGRPVDSKQGSDGTVELGATITHNLETAMEQTLILYNTLIEKGVAPEQARMVLPQSMMTEWIWTGSLAAFARIVLLRSSPDAQKECTFLSDLIDIEISKNKNLKISWQNLKEQ